MSRLIGSLFVLCLLLAAPSLAPRAAAMPGKEEGPLPTEWCACAAVDAGAGTMIVRRGVWTYANNPIGDLFDPGVSVVINAGSEFCRAEALPLKPIDTRRVSPGYEYTNLSGRLTTFAFDCDWTHGQFPIRLPLLGAIGAGPTVDVEVLANYSANLADPVAEIFIGGSSVAGPAPLSTINLAAIGLESAGKFEFEPCCRHDLDLDDAGDFDDLLLLLAFWGPCGVCPADIDEDGTVGISDLLALLAGWGPC